MATQIVPATIFDVNPETEVDPVTSAHTDAKDLITWLSIPGVAARYGIVEVEWVIGMLKILMSSCTPIDAIEEINHLTAYVRDLVGQGE